MISPIVSANPLVTLLLAQLFLSRLEELTRSLFLGIAVVVFGVVLVVLPILLRSRLGRAGALITSFMLEIDEKFHSGEKKRIIGGFSQGGGLASRYGLKNTNSSE